MTGLRFRQDLPASMLGLGAAELHRAVPHPTLFHLPGLDPRPLFLSVLQHGNETTGWEAVRSWLAQRPSQPLPRSLMLFVANPQAAREHQRMLEGQPDFNRCWPGTDQPHEEVSPILAEVTERVCAQQPFASVDIHNNSGRNPHYGATTRLETAWLALARRFQSTVVYFQQPLGVQCEAFSHFCPAITVECGLAGLSEGIPHCRAYVDDLMRLDALPGAVEPGLDLYHTVARVTVHPDLEFGFGKSVHTQVHFRIDIDALNFVDLPVGTPLAEGDLPGLSELLDARDLEGLDVAARWFEIRDGALRSRRPMTLSMLSRRPEIVRSDCFCYVMERLEGQLLKPEPAPAPARVVSPTA